MAERRDGGRVALIGFLYQFLGTVAISASGFCVGDTPDDPELNALLTVVPSAHAFPEFLDQDDVLVEDAQIQPDPTMPAHCICIQFKYARRPDQSPLRPHDIREILAALDRSADEAREQGKRVTGYVLVTNRSLSPAVTNEERFALLASAPNLLTEMVEQRPLPLYVASDQDIESWSERIIAFARRLGATDQEIDDGIDKLLGQLLRGGAHLRAALARDDLVEAFTRHAGTRFLTARAVAEQLRERIIADSTLMADHALVRRVILNAITMSATTRALVFIHGSGGCGKTAALRQWMEETLDESASHDYSRFSGVFIHILPASKVNALLVTDIIANWANLPTLHSRRYEGPDAALERLMLANPRAIHPIFHLGLDGLDEYLGSDQREDWVRSVIMWFWEEDLRARATKARTPPRATLVVTCRDTLESAIERWLPGNVYGTRFRGELPADVEISDFTPKELLEAARLAMSPVRDALERVLAGGHTLPLASSLPSMTTIPVGIALPRGPSLSPTVLDALKHPAIWGAFAVLDEQQQTGILRSEAAAMQELAASVVERVCRKAQARQRAAFNTKEAVFRMLCVLARANQGMGPFTKDQWKGPLHQSGLVLHGLVIPTLYGEAISSGLILEDNPRLWRWRHGFVREYLASHEDEWGDL